MGPTTEDHPHRQIVAAALAPGLRRPRNQNMKHIEELIADGGEITIGALAPYECVASGADASNALALLVRRDGETLTALLRRLDKAIGMAFEEGIFADEVNGRSD